MLLFAYTLLHIGQSAETPLWSMVADFDCCNGSFESVPDGTGAFNIPNTAQLVNTSIACCYGSDFVDLQIQVSSDGVTSNYICNGSSASFGNVDNVTYTPDAATFCGKNQFVIDNTLPSELDISASADIFLSGSSNGSFSSECLCLMQYSQFVLTTAYKCTNNETDELCSVPNGITGYVDVDIGEYTNGSCGCVYEFYNLKWDIANDTETLDINDRYEFWHYIPWDANTWKDDYQDNAEECLSVKVWSCDVDECIWQVSDNINLIDTATTHFDTAGYWPGFSSACYCYAMIDVCMTEMITSTSDKGTSTEMLTSETITSVSEYISTENTFGESVNVRDYAKKLSYAICNALVIFNILNTIY